MLTFHSLQPCNSVTFSLPTFDVRASFILPSSVTNSLNENAGGPADTPRRDQASLSSTHSNVPCRSLRFAAASRHAQIPSPSTPKREWIFVPVLPSAKRTLSGTY
jgi:hypothetical protein